MILAIASGKGGTGKTTVSLNLARVNKDEIWLLDCDVEEPNAHLFLKTQDGKKEEVAILVPQVDEEKCNACGKCARFCQRHAIVSFGTKPLLFPEECNGCGGCALVCPTGAISETPRTIGSAKTSRFENIHLAEGRLDVGNPMASPIIDAVKKIPPKDANVILDAPPGTSCPAVASLLGADYAALVTEPTPFGLNDLALAVATVRAIGVPFGVIVNRHMDGNDSAREYCASEGIEILGEIPDERRAAEVYSTGSLLADALPSFREHFETLAAKIRERMEAL